MGPGESPGNLFLKKGIALTINTGYAVFLK